MRYFHILILTIIFVSETGYSQNIKKILTTEDLTNLETNDIIYKNLTDLDFADGFTGTILVAKKGNKIRSTKIGTWTRTNSNHGDNAIAKWDSTGRLFEYKEFNINKTALFDCIYTYDTINGKYYRLEDMEIFDDSGNPIIKGHRYWRTTKDEFGLYKSFKKRKFGTWEYFDGQGNIIKRKKYREIK